MSEWLEWHAGKQGVADSIPTDAYIIVLNVSLSTHWSQLSDNHTNEIKHNIHPE